MLQTDQAIGKAGNGRLQHRCPYTNHYHGLSGEFVWLLVLAMPGTVLGTRIGAFAYRRLSDRQFDRIVLSLLCFSGLVLFVPYL